jgi:quinol monooxygenase YgiN
MIIVRTTLNVFPEKQLEVIQTLLSLIEPVRGEPGCNSCCAFCDISDQHRLILLEEWETRKDLDLHIQSYRFGVLLGTRPLLSEPPQIQIHTVSRTRGMETVHAIRQNQEAS